jgi:hypothetical protein
MGPREGADELSQGNTFLHDWGYLHNSFFLRGRPLSSSSLPSSLSDTECKSHKPVYFLANLLFAFANAIVQWTVVLSKITL